MTPSGTSSSGSPLAAALIDMDGTLLDSERIWDVALEHLATWLGGTLSDHARTQMVGSALASAVAIVHDDLGIEADPESSGAYLTSTAEHLFGTDLAWKPGARELLEALRNDGVPVCLVTSTHRRMAEIALDFMGRSLFAGSVCGDEVSRNKPHPEPYLRAAAMLHADPACCVVVEDSPAGIASGEAAGAAVVAVPGEVWIEPGPGRTIVASLTEVSVHTLRGLVNDRVRVE